ncbi:hypothetical protein [Streptomyces sp. NPDC050422]|uniref:hypothetical protein n=1 Tax=Streptomyces sp. NPDC050422 TaxID=3365614 RepID=UPI0037B9C9D5
MDRLRGGRARSQRNRTALAAAALASAVTVLAGCGSDVPALEFGAAKPSGPRLDAQPPQGSSLPVAQWPDACEALGDDEILAILPQAEDFEREPVKVTVLNFNPLTESEPGTTGDVPKGGCTTSFGLPAEYESKHNSRVRIVFQSVADPALVAKAYAKDRAYEAKDGGQDPEKYRDLGASLGPAGCFLKEADQLVCHQGPYEFEVSGSSTADGVGEYPESDKNWREEVLTEVVRTLSARMDGRP